MNLREAAAKLNEHSHNGRASWRVHRRSRRVWDGVPGGQGFSEFEARAIAEAYRWREMLANPQRRPSRMSRYWEPPEEDEEPEPTECAEIRRAFGDKSWVAGLADHPINRGTLARMARGEPVHKLWGPQDETETVLELEETE